MPALAKATLQEISADAAAKPVAGTEIAVQFNPQSLKLALANKVEGGDTQGRQRRQYLGKTSTTLTFDLLFDTADIGTTDKPVSVRTQTSMIERFVLPQGKGNDKQAPPKCRFHWDQLVIDGIIEDVSIDFELFAANGTPLRAKVGVTIKEQDAKYQLMQYGPGANKANTATPPGKPGTGPGSAAGGPTDSSAQAQAGESAADFAVRMGLDPAAWRGIAGQLGASASLSLSAGASIGFSSTLSAGAGIGLFAGVDASVGGSVEASFGLSASVEAGAGASFGIGLGADVSAGFALSAAGGLGAAIEAVTIVNAESAAADARRSFGDAVPPAPAPRAAAAAAAGAGAPARGAASLPAASVATLGAPGGLPPPAATVRPALPDQTRTPMQFAGSASRPLATAAAPAPPPPLADPRAASFGQGVPLRPRVGSAADQRADLSAGRAALRPARDAPDPTAAPWTRLPSAADSRAADRAQARRRPSSPCGCDCD